MFEICNDLILAQSMPSGAVHPNTRHRLHRFRGRGDRLCRRRRQLFVVACADSTIAPIFAGGLAALTTIGSHVYFGLAASFALMVGLILLGAGFFRFGWLADLASKPVTIGFLAGIACHIVISQAPSLLGIAAPEGDLLQQAAAITGELAETNRVSLLLGLTVFTVTVCADWLNPHIPGALLGIVAATVAAYGFGLDRDGVAVVGQIKGEFPHLRLPSIAVEDLVKAAPLAFVVVAAIMVQTASATRTFTSIRNRPTINRDFAGVGAANLVAGLFGAFPVNASPPLTGIVAEAGGRSKFAGLVAVALMLGIAMYGTALLAHVPLAALAGTLMFVAIRLVRVADIAAIFRGAFGEFVLILVTLTAIVVLPVGTGVATGIVLSLLHGRHVVDDQSPSDHL